MAIELERGTDFDAIGGHVGAGGSAHCILIPRRGWAHFLVKDVHVTEPIGYLELIGLTEQCYKVVTDSGGYQKEAYFAGKQACVVMPDSGWRGLIDAGQNVLFAPGEIHAKVFSAGSPRASLAFMGMGMRRNTSPES